MDNPKCPLDKSTMEKYKEKYWRCPRCYKRIKREEEDNED